MPLVKEIDLVDIESTDGGNIVAYAATFDREPDSYGDVIAPGAFEETIKEWNESGDPIPLLYAHDTRDPYNNVGRVVKAEEDERGLRIEAEFDAENERAQYVRKLVRERRVRKMSFAYDVLEDGQVELDNGIKAHELRKLRLFEVSIVPIPANLHADIVDAKSTDLLTKYGKTISRKSSEEIENVVKLISESLDSIEQIKSNLEQAVENLSGLAELTGNEGSEGDDTGGEGSSTGDGEANEEGADANSESEKAFASVLEKIEKKLGV